MASEIIDAALAGLLHDIGKLSLRAGEPLPGPWDQPAEQKYGFRHAWAAIAFVQEFVPAAWRGDLSGIMQHHKPQTPQENWIHAADNLSLAGPDLHEDDTIAYMQSVFSHLAGYNNPALMPLNRLNPTRRDSLFPSTRMDNTWSDTVRGQYRDLWQQFMTACRAQNISQIVDRQVYLETLLSILQEYTWSVPATDVPDVSLFDHLRTTAAIAACFAGDERSITWCQGASMSTEPACLLVGADLSGVQSFIYTLASSGAAKSLRARSFYVQLISEAVALAVLDGLGLPATNLIYVGGGSFQLLAPVSIVEKLTAIRQDLTERLLLLHEGALGLTLRWKAVSGNAFADIGKVRDDLGQEINRAKAQPYAVASTERLAAAIGQALTEGGDPQRFCRVTGEDGPTVTLEDGEWKAAFVRSLEKLGRQLPRGTHIVLARRPPTPISRATDWQQALQALGVEAQIVTGELAEPLSDQARGLVRVWRLTPDPDPQEAYWLGPVSRAERVISYRPFARLTPSRLGEVLTFDDLAQPRSGALRRWGVLRMDVDNLGKLFQSGFGARTSLARMASLSFALRLFFEGWLPQLAKPGRSAAESKDDLSNYLYLQYSGGDDVFVVGAWDALPEFAARIRKSLSEYAGGNPAVTVSAGIVMVDAGFPLYQAAEQAQEAEAAAKRFTRQAAGGLARSKDAVTFMGLAQDWSQFAETQGWAYRLAEAVTSQQLSRSALQTVQALDAQIRQAERKARMDWLSQKNVRGQTYIAPKLLYGRWTWMAAYQLTRLAQTSRDDGKQLASTIQKAFLQPESREQLRAFGLSARWAQFLTRGGKG